MHDLGKMRRAIVCPHHSAEVAQLAEHSPEKAGVDSSILSLGTTPSPLVVAAYADLRIFAGRHRWVIQPLS